MMAKVDYFSSSFRRSYPSCFMTTALFIPGHIPRSPGYNSDKAPSPTRTVSANKTLGAPNEIEEHFSNLDGSCEKATEQTTETIPPPSPKTVPSTFTESVNRSHFAGEHSWKSQPTPP